MSDGVIRINGRELIAPSVANTRLSILLWGASGCGKTTLAATAPGTKLWVNFDPDGVNSLITRDDVLVLDLSAEKHPIVVGFKQDDILGLEKLVKDRPDIQTVVLDSITALSVLCTENAVANVKSASIENPGMKGYGWRNAVLLRACVSLLRITKKLNLHFIMICHEDAPSMSEDGIIQHITMALGGKMAGSLGLQISEIWWCQDTGKERRVAVRPVRQRTPVKSRMFDTTKGEFVLKYDAVTGKGSGIKEWYEQWMVAKGQKIPLPVE